MRTHNRSYFSCLIVSFCIILSLGISAMAEGQTIVPPVARMIPRVDTSFGDVRIDNYFWLRERTNPEVMKYLEEENQYAAEVMKPTQQLQDQLYKEMRSRIKETDLSVPVKMDDYYYYTRLEEGKQYPIRCRKKGTLEAPEEILLDENVLAEGHDYLEIGVFKVSPDQKLLAFSVDTNGSEDYTLYVKDLSSGKLLSDEVPNTYYSAEWANDNHTIFYTIVDEAQRPYRVYRHTLGSDPKEDFLVYEEKDQAFEADLEKTRSRQFLLIDLGSETTSEVRYLNADSPADSFKVIQPRQHEVEYSVSHHGDDFYIVTNDNAKNFKLMETPVTDPSKTSWKEVIPTQDSVKIDGIDVFKNHLVVYERIHGLKQIRIKNFTDNEDYYVDFPEPVYTFWAERNPDFNTTTLRFDYTSLITPRSVYDYDMDTKNRELKKQQEVLGGYDPGQYQSERIYAQAADGTMVPISLVYKKGLVKDGKNPLLLYGYGAYGISSDPVFSSSNISLLDRGFVYAIAHVRGGGEMGRYWYDDGKLLHKKNTFIDFIACAEHLIADKYTSSDLLVINGASAGGLLMGAVTNLRPDLFRIVIANVPFVDLINTMLDPSLPLTVIEYEEWGNPNEKVYYDYMRSYSPYDNVEAKNYPNMLITAGLNDPRVSYWEPAKWTAKLRANKTDKNLLLLKTKMESGHFGATGRFDELKDTAFEFAFIFNILGISK
jgi:oligopeptidase B